MKITICAIAKNEDRYLEDWLKYHYDMGFTHITVYDNNIVERRGEVEQMIKKSKKLKKWMKKNTSIVDVCGISGYQVKAYSEYYKNNTFDWCAFLDIDEFVEIVHWNSLMDMLTDPMFESAGAIHLPWDTISDDDIVDVPDDFVYKGKRASTIRDPNMREKAASEWETIPVYKRFHISSFTYEPHCVKQFIRGGFGDIKVDVHHLNNRSINILTPNGKPRPEGHNFNQMNEDEFEEYRNFACIKHYRTKTIREYLRQKYLNRSSAINTHNRTFFVYDYFFRINNKTPEKEEYYRNHHIPISLNILATDSLYDEDENPDDLCYIIGANAKKYKSPFVVGEQFVLDHLDAIDMITIV